MQKICRIVRMGIFWLAMAVAVGVLLAGVFFPRVIEKYLPFRLYTVLTDSMAPVVPPMSLVLVRQGTPDAAGTRGGPNHHLPGRALREKDHPDSSLFPYRMG